MEESIKYLKEQFELPEMDIRTYSPLTLAYIGDGIYELIVRTILVGRGNSSVNALNRKASAYVNAAAQSDMIGCLKEELTEEERQVYKRGRNAKTFRMARHATISEYHRATGFEALMGYLYLTDQLKRLIDLIKLGMERMGGLP